jgi:plasmid stabilization system protein ParE
MSFTGLCLGCHCAGTGLQSRRGFLLLTRKMTMPRGDKSSYTDKQKRKAEHIEKGYKDRGVSEKVAEKRAWATVNKESGGGKKSGSGKKGSGKSAGKKSSGGREKSSGSKSSSSKSSTKKSRRSGSSSRK